MIWRQSFWFLSLLILAIAVAGLALHSSVARASERLDWSQRPPQDWPQITMINEIEYVDQHHPVAGCAFLLDTGTDTLAVTAKHILTYFKSQAMKSVSFEGTLKNWRMYPKDNPEDMVLVDTLVNTAANESIKRVPCAADWLLFSTRSRSANIQPLCPRMTPLIAGEEVYIVGWRYSDKDCPQVIYRGAYVRSEGDSHLISTEELKHNKIPGLSGSPVVDSEGLVIGLMSQSAGPLARLSSTTYPLGIIGR